MDAVIFITDCTGIKQDALKNVSRLFFEEFKIEAFKTETFTTPLSFESFQTTINSRIESLMSLFKGREYYYASIQKGYYEDGGVWFFGAIASIVFPDGTISFNRASSVQLPKKSSLAKKKNPLRNFSDLLLEEFPHWNKNDSVYELLTGEKEQEWLEQPLRICMKYLLRK